MIGECMLSSPPNPHGLFWEKFRFPKNSPFPEELLQNGLGQWILETSGVKWDRVDWYLWGPVQCETTEDILWPSGLLSRVPTVYPLTTYALLKKPFLNNFRVVVSKTQRTKRESLIVLTVSGHYIKKVYDFLFT